MSASAVKTMRWVFFWGDDRPSSAALLRIRSLTIRSPDPTASWDKIIGNGELLVIIWALCAWSYWRTCWREHKIMRSAS